MYIYDVCIYMLYVCIYMLCTHTCIYDVYHNNLLQEIFKIQRPKISTQSSLFNNTFEKTRQPGNLLDIRAERVILFLIQYPCSDNFRI